jgi:hypothetical protein
LEVQEVKRPSYVVPHKGTKNWYYRKRVTPSDLIPILGFSEYRESLGTPSLAEACVRGAIRHAEVMAELAAADKLLKKQQASDEPAVPLKLTPEALVYIRDAVRAHALRVDEEFRRDQPTDD